ncbi:fungal-specific transcription factor domain-containing protein [Aspergillus ambiguus]|uniref:fungal specific transcription factor domain-containing protein n=1 Tax=Aspergillus ambiguus TaxID=176160 RepID=UPI003CCD092C
MPNHLKTRPLYTTNWLEPPWKKDCRPVPGELLRPVAFVGGERPSKARIARLVAENERLRQRLGDGSAESLREDTGTDPQDNHDGDLHQQSESSKTCHSQSVVSGIFISANGDSSYHGLTSTLFETRQDSTQLVNPAVPVEPIRKQLMGEAAYQRQLETLNFQQGKLDFDGVDPELGMHLLSLHWNRQHHSFLITYRPAFMRDMATNGPYFSKLLLNAIYFGASKFSNRPEVRKDPDDARTAGWTFRMRVKELLGSALDRSEITTIQALLVMTSSLFALGDERSAAWLYAGTAFRMIIDLGMHVDATMLPNMRRLSQEDLEIRRRVFWGAFVVDKIQSLYQGRPASLQHFDTKVLISFLDHYEELEPWQPFAYSDIQSYPGSPAYSVSTFTQLCKLSLILNEILNKVYSERSSNRSPHDLIATLNRLDMQLKAWHDALPDHLRYSHNTTGVVPPPHVLSLLALYNVLVILLHRPFVSEGHLHTADPSVALSSFTTCTAAASSIIQLLQAYDHSFSIRRAPYLISYSTYVAATIFVRVAAQRQGVSRAHTNLQNCIDIFKKNQETNWAVRRAQNVILHLMDRMGVHLDDRNPEIDGRLGAVEDRSSNLTVPDGRPLISAPTIEHESPPEIEPSDLDIDMIIQSFIRTQPRPEGQTCEPEFSFGPMAHSINQGMGPAVVPYEEAYSYPQFDDMLFGFNGSPQDNAFSDG